MSRIGANLLIICLLGPSHLLAVQIPRYGLSTRVELHMLPAVTTGPLDPAWHPAGDRIAFSMRGDVWVVPAAGGAAIALTAGPAYHFEPDWSPDGRQIALTADYDGNLDIAIAGADGAGIRRITNDRGVDIQPAWSADGSAIFFASTRNGDFDILRFDLETGLTTTVAGGPGNQFQPAASPDGRTLAYVSPVRGRLGSGGIWSIGLPDGEPRLVHYEETSYRPAPAWTPDGSALVYASDAAGTYDLATVPAAGGNRVRLTQQPLDEFAPAVSPDGRLLAFVSNRTGPTEMFVTSRFGGANTNWSPVLIDGLRPKSPLATIRGRIVGPGGAVVPARIQIQGSDGRGYTPDGGFHRVSPANEIHYFHSGGTFEVNVPAGPTRIEALRGFEWIPADVTVGVAPGDTAAVTLTIERLADPGALQWYSGDTHVHDLHEGRYGLTQLEFFNQFRADDLHVANDLIHMDGTKIMGRWSDLTGADFPASTDEYILRYTQEFRGSFGHVGLLGVQEFIMPLIGGTGGSPYPADGLKLAYLDSVRAQGGIGGFMHPYLGDVSTAAGAAQSDIPVHALLGRGDFYDMVSVASDELASAEMYYHMLNVGVRLPATGGTDNFSNVWRDPSGGTARTYARVEGALSWKTWIDAVRAGRTMATNGPLLFATVNGREPGSSIDGNPASVLLAATVTSIARVRALEIIVDGQVRESVPLEGDQTRLAIRREISVAGARWIGVRATGGKERYIGDNYAFAHTTPVYFNDAAPNAATAQSRTFLRAVIDELWRRVDRRNAWVRAEDKTQYREYLDQAIARLDREIQEERPPPRVIRRFAGRHERD